MEYGGGTRFDYLPRSDQGATVARADATSSIGPFLFLFWNILKTSPTQTAQTTLNGDGLLQGGAGQIT